MTKRKPLDRASLRWRRREPPPPLNPTRMIEQLQTHAADISRATRELYDIEAQELLRTELMRDVMRRGHPLFSLLTKHRITSTDLDEHHDRAAALALIAKAQQAHAILYQLARIALGSEDGSALADIESEMERMGI